MDSEEKKRKKLLVPIFVIMLCAISLIGVAYAANVSSTVSTNGIGAEDQLISLSFSNEGLDIFEPDKKFEFFTVTTKDNSSDEEPTVGYVWGENVITFTGVALELKSGVKGVEYTIEHEITVHSELFKKEDVKVEYSDGALTTENPAKEVTIEVTIPENNEPVGKRPEFGNFEITFTLKISS